MSVGAERCVRVVIKGKVQGVWYRAWTREEARDLRLDGWVRNRRDGSVEAVFSGSSGAVDAMIKLCWAGPPLAQVDEVSVEDHSEEPQPGFEQRATA